MTDDVAYKLGEAIRGAIDSALDAGAKPQEVKDEIAYQVENYDGWDEI